MHRAYAFQGLEYLSVFPELKYLKIVENSAFSNKIKGKAHLQILFIQGTVNITKPGNQGLKIIK